MSEEFPSVQSDGGAVGAFSTPWAGRLSALLEEAVTGLADWGALDLLSDDGALDRTGVKVMEPARAALGEMLGHEQVDLNAPRGPSRAFRTGVTQLMNRLRPEDAAWLGPPALAQALGAVHALAVPLSAGGTSVGVLTLARGPSRPPFTLAELHWVEALCRRSMGDCAQVEDTGAHVEEVLESTSDAFLALDRHGCVTYLNRRAEKLMGRSRAELLGKNIWDEFPSAIASRFHQENQRSMEDRVPAEYVEYFPPLDAWLEIRSFPTLHGHTVYFRDITARLQAEREKQRLLDSLEAQRHLLADVLEQLTVGVVVRTADTGHLLLSNPRMEQILGAPVQQDMADIQVERESGEPMPLQEVPIVQALRTGKAVLDRVVRVERPDGEPVIMAVSAGPLKDARGHPFAALVVAQDITVQRRAEAALLQSVRRFRSLVETTTAVVWVTDADGMLREDSASWRAFTGQSAEAHRGRGWQEAIHPEDRARARQAWDLAVAEGTAYDQQYRLRRRDGTYAHVLARSAPVQAVGGSVSEWIRLCIDITLRQEMEEALRRQTEVVETLNRTGVALAAELELDKLVRRLTDEATRLTGARAGTFFYRADAEGTEVHVAVAGQPPPGEVRLQLQELEALLPSNTVLQVEDLAAEPPDGPGVALARVLLPRAGVRSLLAAPVLGRKHELLGGLVLGHTEPGAFNGTHARLLRGVTAQGAIALQNAKLYEMARQAEERAERAARLAEEFMAILGHDLRTPLQAVALSAKLLRASPGLAEAERKRVERIVANAARMTRMVLDLLDFARARLGQGMPVKPGPVDLHELARRAQEEFDAANPERRLRLQLEGDGAGEWDVDRLAQVLTNLLDNAVKYSPVGSPVTLRVHGEDGEVVLEVHNEGPAIPPELLDTLFEPGNRGASRDDKAANGSLGLGLYIVREILRAHGGTVDVTSVPGEGTTFRARLPRKLPG